MALDGAYVSAVAWWRVETAVLWRFKPERYIVSDGVAVEYPKHGIDWFGKERPLRCVARCVLKVVIPLRDVVGFSLPKFGDKSEHVGNGVVTG